MTFCVMQSLLEGGLVAATVPNSLAAVLYRLQAFSGQEYVFAEANDVHSCPESVLY